jgi:hypothetical protein
MDIGLNVSVIMVLIVAVFLLRKQPGPRPATPV